MTNIYILKLQHGKYYVGKTDNLQRRKQEHINGTACSWTKKHPPILVEQIIPNCSDFDEDKYTKEYMHKFGINNVRGAAYVTDELNEDEIQQIQKEIWGAKNLCTQCGRNGHFVKSCRAKTDVNGNSLIDDSIWVCEYCENEFDDEDDCEKHERYCKSKFKNKNITKSVTCYRCGRSGHKSPDCYARTDVDGDYIDSDDSY